MESKFFSFIAPYLSFIDSGKLFHKPFRWVYSLIAFINLILPFYLLYQAVDNGMFRGPAKFVFVFLLFWVAVLFVCWIGFQIWWDRKDKIDVSSAAGDDFIATPVFAHFIQTFGEWLGTFIGVLGFISAILATLFLGSEGRILSELLGMGFFQSGVIAIIIMPIYGYMIIILTRFMAEQFRALAAIANNTTKRQSAQQ
jgi:hypothetical protein